MAEVTEVSSAAKEAAQESDQSISDWFQAIGAQGEIQIKVNRFEPKFYKGEPVGGYLETISEPVTEEELRQRYGGGKLQLVVQRRGQRNNWVHAASKTVVISGPPLARPATSHEEPTSENGRVAYQDPSLAAQALKMVGEVSKEQRDRYEKAISEGGNHNGGVAEILRVVQDQQTRMFDILRESFKPKEDGLVGKLIDNESNRINALRMQHESELRTLRETTNAELAKTHDYYRGELKEKERTHDREIEHLREATLREATQLKESTAAQLKSLEIANEARLDGLKGRIADLERQLTKSETELTEVKAKKEVPIEDQLGKILQLKELLGELGDKGGEEEKGIVEKVAEYLQPLTNAVAHRVATAPAVPPGPGQMVRQNQPPQRPMRPRPAQPARRQAVAPAPATAQPAAAPQPPPFSNEDLLAAKNFLEGAFRAGREPEEAAQNARNIIAPGLITFLKKEGVDPILDLVAQSDPDSPFVNQDGKTFLRRVAKFLMQ